jgi:hypothetical protein
MDNVRLPLSQKRDSLHGGESVCRDLIETAGSDLPVQEIRSRNLQLRQSRMGFPNLDKLVRIAKGQRLNEDRVDDFEESRIGTDCQRDRQNCGQRERRSAAKGANRGPNALSVLSEH